MPFNRTMTNVDYAQNLRAACTSLMMSRRVVDDAMMRAIRGALPGNRWSFSAVARALNGMNRRAAQAAHVLSQQAWGDLQRGRQPVLGSNNCYG